MTMVEAFPPLLQILVGTAVGGLLGWGYFSHLRRTASLFVSGAPPLRPVLETIARLGGAGLVFFLLMKWGALAAIFALAGFTIGRQQATKKARLAENG